MTLDEMARELGVSKSTVSRALSGKGRIGDVTRKRIQEYARKQGVENNREVVRRTVTRNIGVVLPDDVYISSGPYFQECILGICETAAFLDYDVLIATGANNDVSGVQMLIEREKVDGVILTRSMEDDRALQYLTETGFPVGLTGISSRPGVIQVDTDNEAASENLVSLLVGRGYRHFALILDDMEYIVNQSRYRGFCGALSQNSIDPKKQLVLSGLTKMDMLDSVVDDLIAQKIQCIVCGDDIICTRIMSSLQAKGYRIPKDIAVASLYNSPNLDCFSPSITTVNVSARQVGNMISKQMINYLTGKEYRKKTILDYEILMRKSTNILI